jgi:hypothetical protein
VLQFGALIAAALMLSLVFVSTSARGGAESDDRVRAGEGEAQYDELETRLAEVPIITVPAITLALAGAE